MVELIKPSELEAAPSVFADNSLVVDNAGVVRKATPVQIANAGAPVSSEAQAIAGDDNETRMTPLRVKQVLDDVTAPSVLRAEAWAISPVNPDPSDPDSKSAKTWANSSEEWAESSGVPSGGGADSKSAKGWSEESKKFALEAQGAALYSVDTLDDFYASDQIYPNGSVVAAKQGGSVIVVSPGSGELNHPITGQGVDPVRPVSSELSAPFYNIATGLSDQNIELNRMLSKGGRLHLGAGDYGASAILYVPSNTTLTFDKAAKIIPTSNGGGQIRIGGAAPSSWVALATDVAAGSYAFPVVAGAVAVGDWIEFRSDGLIDGFNTQGDRRCHIAKVIVVSGSTAYIDRPFYYDFLVADSATWGKATVRENVTIDGASINRLDGAFRAGFGFYLQYTAGCRLINLSGYKSKDTPGVDGGAGVSMIRISQSMDLRIEGADVGQAAWYGIALGGFNDNIVIDGIRGRDCRHTVSVVWGNGDPENPSYGETNNLSVLNGVSRETTLAGFDTHDTGKNISFIDCQSFGSLNDSGFQLRNFGTKLIRPNAQFNHFDGVTTRIQGAQDLYVEDPVLMNNGRSGASLIYGRNPKIIGGVIGRNASNDVQICDGIISGTRFEKTTAAAVPCIAQSTPDDGSRNLLNIIGVSAPSPGSGHIFCQAGEARHDLIRLRDNDLRGYGSNAYRTTVTPTGNTVITLGGSRISNADVVNSGSITLTAGGTATITIIDSVQLFRAQGPSFAPEVVFSRYGTTSPIADRGQIFVAQVGNSGTNTILTIKSSSVTDFGTFKWQLIS